MTKPPQKSDSEPTEDIQVITPQILRLMGDHDEDDDLEEQIYERFPDHFWTPRYGFAFRTVSSNAIVSASVFRVCRVRVSGWVGA